MDIDVYEMSNNMGTFKVYLKSEVDEILLNDVIKNNEVNLCDSCCYQYPDCPEENKVFFGDGVGNDNICCCDKYEAITSRNPQDPKQHGKL
jgi:hypothetical protein